MGNQDSIFGSVFHRILDFKNGAGFLSWPFFIPGSKIGPLSYPMLAVFTFIITVAGFLFSQQHLSIFNHRKYNFFSGIEGVVIFLKDNKK